MNVSFDKQGNLVIIIPPTSLKLKDMPETDSLVSLSLASSGGNQAVSLPIEGVATVVKVGVNAFIPIPGRKKVRDASRPGGYYVVDATGKEVLPKSMA